MTVQATSLPRSFSTSTSNGSCVLCEEDFVVGEEAFYATVRRDGHGNPIWTAEAQVAPKDARTAAPRPEGCTCRGRSAHTTRCALWKAGCGCRSRRGRNGRSYVRHGRACENAISWEDRFVTLPGFRDAAVHCQCAADRGLTLPAQTKRTYGRRTEGMFNTGGTGTVAPSVTPAPVGVEAQAVAQNDLATVAGQGVASAVADAQDAQAALAEAREATRRRQAEARGWMESMSRDYAAERAASIRARAEAAAAAKAAREAKAEREAREAKAERQAAASGRFAVLDLSDDGERELEARSLTSGEERFAALDLD